ncbi:cytochrome c1 [Hydrogenophilus thiooxidans]|uniref:cytochrome c1 n=1 Tax=Hydrogenophilus thiooxidans TaxID=2820326 RepID=UPI001C245D3F|nr:cytochrome c1 [Hydrogenophilus thiooxidans]
MKTNWISWLKKTVAVLAVAPTLLFAAETNVHIDKAPVSTNPVDLQHGAKLFVNYCLNCHAASMMRYNRLTELGLTEQQIKDYLLFTGEKVGDLMTIAMRTKDAKKWFGAAPPDLTLIARQKETLSYSGADWLYTYLRTFYRDESRPTGWNNVVFPNVGMPHVLWELQGIQVAEKSKDEHGNEHIKLTLGKPGLLSPAEYDKAVADLVSFLQWMGEPVAEKRKTIGIWVMLYLALFFILTYLLKKAYWKDVH